MFTISVIIPAYNAEQYIEKSIQSALKQPEVYEVVVIDDGSSDDTLKLSRLIQKTNSKVKIYNHKNGANKGRSASRNLGVNRAICNYIAFLDADDYYLANRFTNDKSIFEGSENIDGVYNAIGVHFYRRTSESEKKNLLLTTISRKIEPEQLFDVLMSGKDGYFSIDGLTIKQSVFNEVGYFNEGLCVSEDTEFFYKLALKCTLVGGLLNKPVAMRGVHENNVFNNKGLYSKNEIKMYESLYSWTSKNDFSIETIERFLERIWISHFNQDKSLLNYIKHWFVLLWHNPQTFFTILPLKYFPLVRLRRKYFSFFFSRKQK